LKPGRRASSTGHGRGLSDVFREEERGGLGEPEAGGQMFSCRPSTFRALGSREQFLIPDGGIGIGGGPISVRRLLPIRHALRFPFIRARPRLRVIYACLTRMASFSGWRTPVGASTLAHEGRAAHQSIGETASYRGMAQRRENGRPFEPTFVGTSFGGASCAWGLQSKCRRPRGRGAHLLRALPQRGPAPDPAEAQDHAGDARRGGSSPAGYLALRRPAAREEARRIVCQGAR